MIRRAVTSVLAAACLAGSALAVPSLTGGNASGAPGAVVNVPFSLNNDANVTALQFDLTFDASKIASVGTPTEGTALAATDHEIDSNLVASGRFRILVVSNSFATMPSGQIVVVPFTLSNSVTAGSTVTLTVTDVEMVDANATVVSATTAHGSISVQTAGCAVPGDIAPDGVGNGAVSLADFVLSRRKAAGTVPQNARDAQCGNVAPGAATCVPVSGKTSWCPNPNTSGNPVTLGDAIVIRRLVAQTYQISCAACAPQVTSVARVAGDVAPRGSGDGTVDIGDVVLALRTSVGLEPLGGESAIADVAPARRSGEITLADGNGVVDVADVVLMLRAAVGLESVAWPERAIDVVAPGGTPRVGFSVRVAGWPGFSTVLRVDSAECAGDDSGLDSAGDRWAVTCATDPAVSADGGAIATVTYTGPRVSPAQLSVESTVATPDLQEQPGLLSLAPR